MPRAAPAQLGDHCAHDREHPLRRRLPCLAGEASPSSAMAPRVTHTLRTSRQRRRRAVGLHGRQQVAGQGERHGLRVMDSPTPSRGRRRDGPDADVGQARLYRESIEPHLRAGMMLMFAHGFSIHFGQIDPPGRGRHDDRAQGAWPTSCAHVPGGHRHPGADGDPARRTGRAVERTLAYARALGAGRAGVLETTFKDETETDLFASRASCAAASAR